MSVTLASLAQQHRPSIVRIIVHFKKGDIDGGTGFVYSSKGDVLTCAHMLFRTGQIADILKTLGAQKDKEAALQRYFRETVKKVEIETHDGKRWTATSVAFSGAMDLATLRVKTTAPLPSLILETEQEPLQGEDIFLCGFPFAVGTPLDQFPFACWKGNIMGSCNARTGGYKKRQFMFAYTLALWGASGSPVFSDNGKVIGILTGQMIWGADNILFKQSGKKSSDPESGSLHVPVPYGYITPIRKALAIAKQLSR